MKKWLLLLLLSLSYCLSMTDADIEKGLLSGTLKSYTKSKGTIRALAENAMYKADRYLGLGMVPPVVIKKEKKDDCETISSCSYWIEPAKAAITSSDQLKSLVSPKEWAQMNLFLFIFGQYDKHFGNHVIAKEDGKLYLIDNEAVVNVNQFTRGYSSDKRVSIPWVPIRKNKEIDDSLDSEDFWTVVNGQQDKEWIKNCFPDVDFYTVRDIDNDNCRIWKQALWRQMYVFNKKVSATFSDRVNPTLLKKIESLDEEVLTSFWPQYPFENKEEVARYNKMIQTFYKKTVKRKAMVLEYFKQHPEGIVQDYTDSKN